MSGRIVVVGSINVDLVTRLDRLPRPGETASGGAFEQHHGGKGANQAVAARRLGASVEFIGAVGEDAFGEAAAGSLAAEGVGAGELRRIAGAPTGVALILVDALGENMIAVAPGANAMLQPADVRAALGRLAIGAQDVVLVSHEIPTDTARAALLATRRSGAGDAFNGALAEGLVAGRPLDESVRRAVAAAGLATTRSGAREGMPTGEELQALFSG